MSIESWKEEFYPVSARKFRRDPTHAEQVEALGHSLRKWRGLQKEALYKHDLGVSSSGHIIELISKGNRSMFAVNTSTCALCVQWYRVVKHPTHPANCKGCPLAEVRGGAPCDYTDETADGDRSSPYLHWIAAKDPEPMIKWLETALEAYEKPE